MLYLVIFIITIFIVIACTLYMILARSRIDALVTDVKLSSTLTDWAKEASKQIDTASNRFKRPTWLLGIYIASGTIGLIGGTLYFKTLPAGMICGALMFAIPEQIINQRIIAKNNKLTEQLGMAVRLFTAEYRDTPHPVKALDITSKKVPNPLGRVLKETVREFNSGQSIDKTLLKLSNKISTPYGKLFAQLIRQSFEDNTVTHLFMKLSARLSSHQDLVQENNKQTASNRLIITVMNVAVIPAFYVVTKIFPESYGFFTQEIAGRLIVILALSSGLGAILIDRILNGRESY